MLVPRSSESANGVACCRKDDEQLQVGGSLSRIVVPHPVMQEPRGVQLLYTAYSGWISSGLARWSIDKVTLSDSFGKSSSVCKKDLVLESGVPVLLPLFAGECNPPRDTSNAQVSILWAGDAGDAGGQDADGSLLVPRSSLAVLLQLQAGGSLGGSLGGAGPSSDTNEVLGGLSGLGGLYPAFNLTALLAQHNATHPSRFVPTQVVHVGDEGLNDTVASSSSSSSSSPSSATSPAPEEVAATDAVDEAALLELLDATGPAWQPLLDDLPETTNNGLDGGSRNRDDARAFDDQLQRAGQGATTLPPQPANSTDRDREDATVAADAGADEVAETPTPPAADATRPEISEPVLVRSPAAPAEAVGDRRSFQQADQQTAATKPEITEPVLKPTTSTTTTTTAASSSVADGGNGNATAADDTTETMVPEAGSGAGRDLRDKASAAAPEWTPALELNPPPLGGTHIWQHWPPSKPVSVSPSGGDKEGRRAANNSRAFSFFDADPSQPPPPPPPAPTTGNWSERSITVQLLPQRLVALLEQAERYARLAFLPFAAVNSFFSGRDLDSPVATATTLPPPSAVARAGAAPQRKAKHVPAAAARATASPSPGLGVTPASASAGDPTPYLVPLTYSRDGSHPKAHSSSSPPSRYIPLSKPRRARRAAG